MKRIQAHSHETDDTLSEINITPLVDVMLVLLVAFIVSAPVLERLIELNLPKESVAAPVNAQAVPRISIDAAGLCHWDGEPVTETVLEEKLLIYKHSAPNANNVLIAADRQLPYDKLVRIMALAGKSGMTQIGFVIEPDSAP